MNKEELHKAFKLAIEKEEEAYNLYSSLAQSTNDKALKVIFEGLAADEKKHWDILLSKYNQP